MPGPKPRITIKLTTTQRASVRGIARSSTRPFRLVQRARIVLLAADGMGATGIARRLGIEPKTARKWRAAFRAEAVDESLEDRPRSGRPGRIPGWVRCEVLKFACMRPDAQAQPFRSTWTLEDLRLAVTHHTGTAISRSEICRTLQSHTLRPHTVRMWLHSPDPEFRAKVVRVCELYASPPPGATVLCVDEKTGMQALERIHPTRPAGIGRPVRYEFEYCRHGTRALIAAFNPHSGKVFAQVRRQRRQKDLNAFMDALAKNYPTGDVYVIWDNLNTHAPKHWMDFNGRHGGRFHFVYTPKHASWLNQIEIWFSILQRRLLRHGSFVSAQHLAAQVVGFARYWNAYEAHPFRWKFSGEWPAAESTAA
jgi:transposase